MARRYFLVTIDTNIPPVKEDIKEVYDAIWGVFPSLPAKAIHVQELKEGDTVRLIKVTKGRLNARGKHKDI